MPARSMGSGVISFGLVNIPVKVFSANSTTEKISFNQLHAEKKIRLKQQMIDPETGDAVPKEKIVKGYEFAKDQYIVIPEEELDKLELTASKAMEISEFVPLDSVDPLFFESGYYLGPEKGAERAYKLLAKALAEMKFAAVAKYCTRGRENLIVMRPMGGAIVMQQLRYQEEVKALSEIPIPEANVSDAELGLAKQFIQNLAQPAFDVSKYKDTYRERLKTYLDSKIKGESPNLEPAPAPQAKVVDLMEALKASLMKSSTPAAAPAPVAAPAPAPVLAAVPAPAEEDRKPPQRAARAEKAEKKKKAAE